MAGELFDKWKWAAGLSAVAFGLYAKIAPLAKKEHSCLSLASRDLQSINPAQFPQFIKSNTLGLWLFTHKWEVPSNPKGVVFICHGFGEHILRYEHTARRLNAEGYSVYGMDHQGHGQSEGDRGYFEETKHVVADYWQMIEHMVAGMPASHANLPKFLLGHSMGGLMAINVAHATGKKKDFFKGLIISGPALMPDPKLATPTLVKMAYMLASILPKFSLEALPVEAVCRDKQVVYRYACDPLVYHGGFSARTAVCMLNTMKNTLDELAGKTTFPYLLIHGDKDKLCLLQGSEVFHERSKSSDKTFKQYPGAFHEILSETNRKEVTDDVIAWLNARA